MWHHEIGEWLPVSNATAKFGSVYTIDTLEEQTDCRQATMPDRNLELLDNLQVYFNLLS